ncbi:ABC transporter permease subunit [Labrys sp. KNU-23]|uniref:ABC transporter permease n=1 Tax=Labrys TaxID=204476 RepID=UPI0011F07BF3|nr:MULTISPECIES: ABC transporter permease subunit [Labrys]MDT3380061.1 ABC transporter permease subunit [Labrys neptuniae]QEN85827.1 ABC transporter permease subunit [Labrys sp. KNU-23]
MDFSEFADSIATSIDDFTTYLSTNYSFIFDFIGSIINGINGPLATALTSVPAWVIIAVAVVGGILLGRITLAVLGGVGLTFILAMNLWAAAMLTLSLVLTAAFIALLIGIPLGMLIAESKKVNAVVEPVLDFMQTMPPFVLLVPAVFFFGVGTVPGVIATIFFAIPLPTRLTAHGLRMVESEMVEAGEAFGAGRMTILFLIKLPQAFRSIMAGVNQCIMMSLSMVIIASMIGAGGLGDEIIRSISRLQVGKGVEAGLAVVVLAIVIDRFSKRISQKVDPTA